MEKLQGFNSFSFGCLPWSQSSPSWHIDKRLIIFWPMLSHTAVMRLLCTALYLLFFKRLGRFNAIKTNDRESFCHRNTPVFCERGREGKILWNLVILVFSLSKRISVSKCFFFSAKIPWNHSDLFGTFSSKLLRHIERSPVSVGGGCWGFSSLFSSVLLCFRGLFLCRTVVPERGRVDTR